MGGREIEMWTARLRKKRDVWIQRGSKKDTVFIAFLSNTLSLAE